MEDNTLSDNKKLCACGCKAVINRYDGRGRERQFKVGHRISKVNHREPTKQYFKYKGKNLYFSYDVRNGVCNWCRAVELIDTSYTQRHHDEHRYDDEHPLRFTIELCAFCHTREKHRLKELDLSLSKTKRIQSFLRVHEQRRQQREMRLPIVQDMLTQGLSQKEIAAKLGVWPVTIRTYTRMLKTIEEG